MVNSSSPPACRPLPPSLLQVREAVTSILEGNTSTLTFEQLEAIYKVRGGLG